MTGNPNETLSRILAELEEAGEEEMVTLVNTVMPRTGESGELDMFSSALIDLIVSGDITAERRSRGRSLEPISPANEVRRTLSGFAFDRVEGFWVDATKAFDVYVVASPAGLERARRILDERGYRWWNK